ncbi:hypothetical protein N9E76_01320, partial [bacterium]|nr:hypothetical protein [bacterium]
MYTASKLGVNRQLLYEEIQGSRLNILAKEMINVQTDVLGGIMLQSMFQVCCMPDFANLWHDKVTELKFERALNNRSSKEGRDIQLTSYITNHDVPTYELYPWTLFRGIRAGRTGGSQRPDDVFILSIKTTDGNVHKYVINNETDGQEKKDDFWQISLKMYQAVDLARLLAGTDDTISFATRINLSHVMLQGPAPSESDLSDDEKLEKFQLMLQILESLNHTTLEVAIDIVETCIEKLFGTNSKNDSSAGLYDRYYIINDFSTWDSQYTLSLGKHVLPQTEKDSDVILRALPPLVHYEVPNKWSDGAASSRYPIEEDLRSHAKLYPYCEKKGTNELLKVKQAFENKFVGNKKTAYVTAPTHFPVQEPLPCALFDNERRKEHGQARNLTAFLQTHVMRLYRYFMAYSFQGQGIPCNHNDLINCYL